MTITENQLISNKYWTKKLKSCISIDKLVCDKELVCIKLIDRNELSYFNKLSGKKPIAEFTILYSIFNALLNKYLDSETEFVLTNKINDSEKLLLLHSNSKEAESLKELLNETKKEIQDAYKFSEYDEKSIQISSFSNYSTIGFSYGKYSKNNYNKCQLVLSIEESSGNLELKILFTENFIEKSIVDHFLNNLYKWLIDLEANLNKSVKSIDLLSKEEKHQILNEFNNTKKDYPKDKTIVDLFEDQVKSTPNNVAIIYKEEKLTYFELNQKVNQFANYLSEHYSISKGDVVVVLLPKSIDTIISYLTILKLGAIYLPVDISNPKSRIDYILKDSHSKLVISDSNTIATQIVESDSIFDIKSFQNHKFLKGNFNRKISPTDIAYLIYTSGSTGNPKGVLIRHTSNVNMSLDQIREFQITEEDSVAWFASVGFDASISEMMMCFYSGATLSIPTEEQIKNTDKFIDFINEQSISVVTFPPSYLDLINSESLKSLRCVITAGEKANPIKVKEVINQSIDYYNAYGPTEYSVCTSIYKVPKDFDSTQVPIGKPIANTNVYILDSNFNPKPIGISGTLYVSGVGLTKGYLNRANLNQEKFIANPFNPDSLIYDTGDVAKWDTNGNIIFEGREDYQVKIRGHRVELGEIEVIISNYSKDLIQIVVEPKQIKDTNHLIAYYTLKEGKYIEKELLRKYLEENLPEYMIPSFFIELEEIPITQNGKVDRKMLPNPNSKDRIRKEYVAPSNETEKKLVEIWEEVLGIEEVGITDDFFELGGNSLMIVKIQSRIRERLNKNISYSQFVKFLSIKKISNKLSRIKNSRIKTFPLKKSYPLTPLQKAIWIQQEINPSTNYYNLGFAFEIEGNVDVSRIEKVFLKIIKKNEILRTSFKYDHDNSIRQFILSNIHFKIEVRKVQKYLSENIEQEFLKKFDLTKPPLFRIVLLKIESKSPILIFVIHHLICDGWSLNLIKQQFFKQYNGFTIKDSEHKIDFKDYAYWFNEQLDSQNFHRQKVYWLNKFKNEQYFKINIPKISTIKNKTKDNALITTQKISNQLYAEINQFIYISKTKLFDILTAAIMSLMYRYSNQEKIILAIPYANRHNEQIEGMIGPTMNTLLVRHNFQEKDSFSDLLNSLNYELIQAFENSFIPFELWFSELSDKSNKIESFNVMLVLQNFDIPFNYDDSNIEFLDVKLEYRKHSQFDIIFRFTETSNGIELNIEYNTIYFDQNSITRLISHFESLLYKALKEPNKSVNKIDYLSPDEDDFFNQINNTESYYNDEDTYLDIFKSSVKKYPLKLAVIYNEKKLTYQDLDELSSCFANYLILKHNIKEKDRICFKTCKSDRLIVMLLGVLKTGASYVPIDPTYPSERKKLLEEISKPSLIINDSFEDEFFKCKNKKKTPLNTQISPESVFHIMFTSGTTGKPKGVVLTHKNIVNFIQTNDYFNLDHSTILLSTVATSFDTTNLEFWGVLAKGGTLIIENKNNLLDYSKLKNSIVTNKVNSLWLTASWFPRVVDHDLEIFSKLKQFITGGDVVSPIHINKLKNAYPNLRITNGYGPTECTTFATTFKISYPPEDTIPIGRPLKNYYVYILNSNFIKQPIGVYGELFIGGNGVASGYFDNKLLTSQRFIKDPFKSEGYIYRTGDMVRWSADGNIDFLGRKDTQIKIRGHRIEPLEIEQEILNNRPFIKEVVVCSKEIDSEDYLVCYLVCEKFIETLKLKNELKKVFPNYMIPTFFVRIKKIPLTPNGKVDRNRLPLPDMKKIYASKKKNSLKNGYEKKLASLWMEILKVRNIKIDDDFFDLGGHSLLVFDLAKKISLTFNIEIELNDLYDSSNFKNQIILIKQAKLIKDVLKEKKNNIIENKKYEISLSQERWLLTKQIDIESSNNNIVFIQEYHNSYKEILDFFLSLIKKHDILKTVYSYDNKGKKFYQEILPFNSSAFSIERSDKKAEVLKEELKLYKFNLTKLFLFKVFISSDRYLVITMHHLICDAWSIEIIQKEYLYFINNDNKLDNKAQLTYADYCLNQRKYQKSETYVNDKEYWISKLHSAFPSHVSIHNSSSQFLANYEYDIEISKLNFGKRLSFIILLGIFVRTIMRVFDLNQFYVGIPFHGRDHYFESTIGFFPRILHIKIDNIPSNDNDLIDYLKFEYEQSLKHKEFPYHLLLDELNLKIKQNEYPITGFFFNFLEIKDCNKIAPILTTPNYQINPQVEARYDICPDVKVYKDVINFNYVLNAGKISHSKANKIHQNMLNIINDWD